MRRKRLKVKRKKHQYSEQNLEKMNRSFETRVQDKWVHNKGFKHRDFFNV